MVRTLTIKDWLERPRNAVLIRSAIQGDITFGRLAVFRGSNHPVECATHDAFRTIPTCQYDIPVQAKQKNEITNAISGWSEVTNLR